ncbi:MAG: hypothetical protein SA339_08300 [Methanomassiliicoccus sp.]|nr:hypothetical protein [Methanomassiliicoccus sp.]
MQWDPRAIKQMRVFQSNFELKDSDSLILFHALIPEALKLYGGPLGQLQHLSEVSQNLITTLGSVKYEADIRKDDWALIRDFFEKMSDYCLILSSNPMATLQAFLIVEGEKR